MHGTHGIELISRVLPASDWNEQFPEGTTKDLFEEISDLVVQMAGYSNDKYGAFPVDFCGLHVHVGLPPNNMSVDTFPLPTLQHLAHILVQYERTISMFRPPPGRGEPDTTSEYDCMSNRSTFLYEVPRVVKKPVDIKINRGRTQTIMKNHHYERRWPLTDIRNRIFMHGITLDMLVRLMGREKGCRVNWVNVIRPADASEGPRTIEIKQHAGTVNAGEIEKWVRFCVAMVRAAERMANTLVHVAEGVIASNAEIQGEKYRMRSWEDAQDPNDLLDLLGLSDEDRACWLTRYNHWFEPEPKDSTPPESSDDSDDLGFDAPDDGDDDDNDPSYNPTGRKPRTPTKGGRGSKSGPKSKADKIHSKQQEPKHVGWWDGTRRGENSRIVRIPVKRWPRRVLEAERAILDTAMEDTPAPPPPRPHHGPQIASQAPTHLRKVVKTEEDVREMAVSILENVSQFREETVEFAKQYLGVDGKSEQ